MLVAGFAGGCYSASGSWLVCLPFLLWFRFKTLQLWQQLVFYWELFALLLLAAYI